MEEDRIVAEEMRKDDKQFVNSSGQITTTIERYIVSVLPENISSAIRAIALNELAQQQAINNDPSQILVDNTTGAKREIMTAKRRVQIRFQDTENLLRAVRDLYAMMQKITRLQSPPKNAIIARNNFYLYLHGGGAGSGGGGVNLGLLPAALTKIAFPGVLTFDSVVRVVGPLVNYGRKLFWNPVGTSSKMSYYRVGSKRSGVRFLVPKGASLFYPRFKPYRDKTLRRKANRTGDAAQALRNALAGNTPPGRSENAGQIAKRIISRDPSYRGLHFTDGWIEYGPAIGWSKLRDPRVPAVGVMFTRKGKLNMDAL